MSSRGCLPDRPAPATILEAANEASLALPVGPGLKLRVEHIPGKGRGVVATTPIRAGEVLERAPVLVCPAAEEEHLGRTALYPFCYAWGPQLEHTAIGLGFASLYNHSYQPNALYQRATAQHLLVFLARRDIAPGEEITVNYNGDPASRDPVWFEVRED